MTKYTIAATKNEVVIPSAAADCREQLSSTLLLWNSEQVLFKLVRLSLCTFTPDFPEGLIELLEAI